MRSGDRVPSIAVIGAQWGDEGKGKITDYEAERADMVVRYQGGSNAGHTIKVGDEVSVYGSLSRVGRTSMVIAIEAWRRNRHQDLANKVTEAVFTFVAVDEDGKPRPVGQE